MDVNMKELLSQKLQQLESEPGSVIAPQVDNSTGANAKVDNLISKVNAL